MVSYTRNVFDGNDDFTVDADGEATISVHYGYVNEDVTLTFEELETMYKTAKAHRLAYARYKDRGYEGEEQYKNEFKFILERI